MKKERSFVPWGPWKQGPLPRHAAPHFTELRDVDATWFNNHYSVQRAPVATDWGLVQHFYIRRHDGKPLHSWTDLQRIKNELAGPERLAVEVYPPDEQLVNVANMYHLWILPEGFALPFELKGARSLRDLERSAREGG